MQPVTGNNMTQTNENWQADERVVRRVERARKRISRLYERLKKKSIFDAQTGKQVRGWRAVQIERRLPNVKWAYDFAVHGVIPANEDVRVRLFLPRKLVRRSYKKRAPLSEWQTWWNGLPVKEKDFMIKDLWMSHE